MKPERPIEIRIEGGRVLSRHRSPETARRPWRNVQLGCPEPPTPVELVDSRTGDVLDRWTGVFKIRAAAVAPAPARRAAAPGYEPLAAVLDEALRAAQAGKGAERHALPGQSFADQPIVWLCEAMDSFQGDVFQACKNALEACRLPDAHARRLLLSAINYLAAAVIVIDRRRAGEEQR